MRLLAIILSGGILTSSPSQALRERDISRVGIVMLEKEVLYISCDCKVHEAVVQHME